MTYGRAARWRSPLLRLALGRPHPSEPWAQDEIGLFLCIMLSNYHAWERWRCGTADRVPYQLPVSLPELQHA